MKKIVLGLLSLIIASSALAWEPAKTINVIVPFAPGSGNEISFRIAATVLEQERNVKFVIQNIPGADGIVGMNVLSEKPTDGQWIGVPSCQNTFVDSEIMYSEITKFKPMDFVFVSNLAKSPLAFVAHSSSSVNTPADLMREIKADKRPIFFAVGSSVHKLAYEYLVDKVNPANTQGKMINYKSPGLAAQDVAGGHIEFGIVSVTSAKALVETGKIKIIGIAGDHTVREFANSPLMNRSVPGLNVYACFGIVLPPGTDASIQQWFSDAFVSALRSSQVKQQFSDNLLVVDERALGSTAMKTDILALKKQWGNYTLRVHSKEKSN